MNDLENLRSEEFVKLGSSNFECLTCGKTCKTVSHIRDHVDTHIDGLLFICQSCNKAYATYNTIRAHESKNNCAKQKIQVLEYRNFMH